MSHPHAVLARVRDGAFPIHARRGACLVPSLSAGDWVIQCRGDVLCGWLGRLANSRASRWEVVLPPSRGQAHLSWFSSTCRKNLAKDLASQGQCLSGLPKGWRCHPRVLSAPKNSLPIFDQSKGCFSCFGIKEDVNKERGPQMDTQLQDGFFEQERSIPIQTGDCALVSTMCRYASHGNVNGANHPPPAISVLQNSPSHSR